MTVTEKSGSIERRILLGCITETSFLARIVPHYACDLLRSSWSNLILKWCVDHFNQYQEAPKESIQLLYEEWQSEGPDEDTDKLVVRFLTSLSEEHKNPIHVDKLLGIAERHFNAVLAEKLTTLVRTDIDSQKVGVHTLEEIESFKRIHLKTQKGIDVLHNIDVQDSALEFRQQVLVRYPGAAGKFFGDELSEDSLVGFLAPPKVGKSYLLLDVAWRAMLQGQNVAYFQVGDLSLHQTMRRFHKRAARRPIKARRIEYPVGLILPTSKADGIEVPRDFRNYDTVLTKEEGNRAFERVAAKPGCGKLVLSWHPNGTISVSGIKAILEGWDREGLVCRTTVIDYADNLASMNPKDRSDLQIAHTWAMLRQLSEVRKCLVVTAAQTNKEGFRTWVMTRSNFRGSLMVLGHVTAFLGINQTDEEKDLGVMRLNFIVRREAEFSETKCLYCAGCLDIASPIIRSEMYGNRP
jgi:hypothetical protein